VTNKRRDTWRRSWRNVYVYSFALHHIVI